MADMGSSILGWQAALVREAAVKKKDVAAAPAVALTLASKFPPRVSYKVCARGYLRYFYWLLKIEKDPQIQSDR